MKSASPTTRGAEAVSTLRTARLVLRPWRDEDLEPFATLNADPCVMRHFPKTLTRAESDAQAARIKSAMAARGWGFWAVECPGIAPFIGFTGLSVPGFDAPFTPCVEIGWRLARAYWGYGYACEAAGAALDYGFGTLGLAEIVAFTACGNARSTAVMRRLGMTHDRADDFLHPLLPEGHPVRPHVLFRITAGRHARQSCNT